MATHERYCGLEDGNAPNAEVIDDDPLGNDDAEILLHVVEALHDENDVLRALGAMTQPALETLDFRILGGGVLIYPLRALVHDDEDPLTAGSSPGTAARELKRVKFVAVEVEMLIKLAAGDAEFERQRLNVKSDIRYDVVATGKGIRGKGNRRQRLAASEVSGYAPYLRNWVELQH